MLQNTAKLGLVLVTAESQGGENACDDMFPTGIMKRGPFSLQSGRLTVRVGWPLSRILGEVLQMAA